MFEFIDVWVTAGTPHTIHLLEPPNPHLFRGLIMLHYIEIAEAKRVGFPEFRVRSFLIFPHNFVEIFHERLRDCSINKFRLLDTIRIFDLFDQASDEVLITAQTFRLLDNLINAVHILERLNYYKAIFGQKLVTSNRGSWQQQTSLLALTRDKESHGFC